MLETSQAMGDLIGIFMIVVGVGCIAYAIHMIATHDKKH